MKSKEKKPWHRFKKLDLKPVDKKTRTIEQATVKHAHKFVISRWTNLRSIRRHVVGWLVLVGILIGLAGFQMSFNYQSLSKIDQVQGGTYAEGIVDSVNTLNPLFASSQAEVSADKLIFSGLLKYDNTGRLQGDLAESWDVQDNGKKYIVTLRPNLTWHDGKALTADDIVFTVNAMQDSRSGALMQQSWRNIKVDALNARQVIFTLPGAYAPFASVLTFAVLPKHILEGIAPENLQENVFSKKPIGSGPFKYVNTKTIDITQGKSAVQLEGFSGYWQGAPRLARFSLYTYADQKDLVKGIASHEVNAASDVPLSSVSRLKKSGFREQNVPLNSGVFALFRTNHPILKDVKIRQSLAQGFNRGSLQKQLEAQPLEGPIINSQLPKTKEVSQASYNVAEAEKLLDEAGWKKDKNGIRVKDGQPLELTIVSVDAGDYRAVVNELIGQWSRLGIKFRKQLIDPGQIQQSVLRPRAYDILVYELEMGGDPDSYAYWHSSQGSGIGLNFSGYSSGISDDALVTARARSDWQLRDAKYTSFAKAWVKDVPALALYQPTLRYVMARNVHALTDTDQLPTQSDRYSSVQDWTVESSPVYKTP